MTRERSRKSKVDGTRLREGGREGGGQGPGEGVQPWLTRPDHLIGRAKLTSG